MCRKMVFFTLVVSVLAMAGGARAATVLQYSFDGALGSDVPSGLVDDTETYTATIIAGSNPASTIKYAGPNPTSYGTTLVKSQYSIIFVFFYILLMTLQGAGCFDDESV
jgi:hypothetical protein